jgi:CDP-diglyceride synthetase
VIDPRLVVAWLALNAIGALLTLIVRRKDGGRAPGERRSGSLWIKYGTYFFITGFVLFLGGRTTGGVGYGVGLMVIFAGRELLEAIDPDSPFELKVVAPIGIAFIGAGGFGLWMVKKLDPSGESWGWLWLVVATTDAYSQLFGQGWGRAKMAPRLSPGKTWFGFWAGTASAVILGASLAYVFYPAPWPVAALAALIVSLAATAGDLVESWMKRCLGIKDFSATLGEHGGVLDRFDSLFAAAPVMAVLLLLI